MTPSYPLFARRTEKHSIRSSHPHYQMLKEFCHKAKNLYNQATYVVKHGLEENGKWIHCNELDKLLKQEKEYPDYRQMPSAQSAQQLLKEVERAWKGFFAAHKDWVKHKDKYLGEPRPPQYLPKDGYFILTLTNQDARLRNGIILFPKTFQGFTITPQFEKREDFVSFQQVRFIPCKNRVIVELIYKISLSLPKEDNGNYLGIDIGVNNLVTAVDNRGQEAFIINGKPLKSINHYANKQHAKVRSKLKICNDAWSSKKLERIWEKRDFKIKDYMHKASHYIVDYCVEHDIHTIIIGKNKNWKQKLQMRKRIKQNFVTIPFNIFISMIQYKAEEFGIAVILTEESYTSGTSFIDDEDPIKENYKKSRRIHRGLFKSNQGIYINADLNAAYQIIKKVVPIKWNSGCVLHPVMLTF